MKIFLKFDHKKKDTLKAIGYEGNGEQANDEIFNLIEKCANADDLTKQSQLAQMIHHELDYEIILFLATKSIGDKMEMMMMKKMKDEFDEFFKRFE